MFVISFIVGVLMGVSYDFLRVIRRVVLHGIVAISIEDIIYWILWTYLLVCILQSYNRGELRLYIILAIILGLVIYINTIGCVFMKLINYILKQIRKQCKKIKKTLKKWEKKGKIRLSITKMSKDRW
ncbi:MAG: spore cortex biosynthesis protein YabQ [Wujia sp.]